MKIKKIATEQFAGIRNTEVELEDGINVIYGKNETGKSTLVNLIASTLFQDAKVDGRKDKDFKANFFPNKDGKSAGDTIDGMLVIETRDGEYKLSKEWEMDGKKDGFQKLSAPQGVTKTPGEINQWLSEVLGYGEGVYKEMLLSSQKDVTGNLQRLLDKKEKTNSKTALVDTVSRAFSEGDGISIEKLEQKIEERIKSLGAYWDAELDRPEKRITRGAGEVLKALYDYEKAENDSKELEKRQQACDDAQEECARAERQLKDKQEDLREFEKYANDLQQLKTYKDAIERMKKDGERFSKAVQEWQSAKEELGKAQELKQKWDNRVVKDKYEQTKAIKDDLCEIDEKLSQMACPNENDIETVSDADKNILKLQNSLSRMNLSAKIKMLDAHAIEIKSLKTGEILPQNGGDIKLQEAVTITVPGVMEMQLAPADVDATKVSAEISRLNTEKTTILSKYDCRDLAGLEAQKKDYETLAKEKEQRKIQLDNELLGENFVELEKKAEAVQSDNLPEGDAIANAIRLLCGGDNIDNFIGQKKGAISAYEKDFISPENLQEKIRATELERAKAESALASVANIPEQYQRITDPEEYKIFLDKQIEGLNNKFGNAREARGRAQNALDDFTDEHDDLREAAEQAKRTFEEKNEELKNWVHIQKVFLAHKDEIQDNPLEELASNFARYLALISGEKIAPHFLEIGKADFTITSGDNLLNYELLSEGTKDTIYLAFRLAVLDHLFPDGGGIIVLDDPMNDMDADRVAQSCALIKDCATRHQVILLTCREEYIPQLGGNEIRL